MIVPLWLEGKPFGTVLLLRGQAGVPYTPEDLLLLQSLSDRTALAYANARLYKDLQSALKEEQITRLKLVQAEKHSALSRMVASVAHELNNPIQTIQNCLFLTQQDIAPDSPIQEFLNMAISEARRVANLVWQLREIYRPSKVGPMQLLDVTRLLEEVCLLLGPHLGYQHVEWVQLPAPDQTPKFTVKGIADQLKQVFLNISMNAIEAMQPDGGKLTVGLEANQRQVPGMIVSFKDTGPGILPENQSKMFDPFFTTKEGGTGLGLSICEDIVRRHGGRIEVESRPGEGAKFSVWLPLFVEE
jgi:signal transduction histidine kinase